MRAEASETDIREHPSAPRLVCVGRKRSQRGPIPRASAMATRLGWREERRKENRKEKKKRKEKSERKIKVETSIFEDVGSKILEVQRA